MTEDERRVREQILERTNWTSLKLADGRELEPHEYVQDQDDLIALYWDAEAEINLVRRVKLDGSYEDLYRERAPGEQTLELVAHTRLGLEDDRRGWGENS